jgi:hypothetical protein
MITQPLYTGISDIKAQSGQRRFSIDTYLYLSAMLASVSIVLEVLSAK